MTKIQIDVEKRTLKIESKPGVRSRITSWVLNKDDEWEVTENEVKVPGMGIFISSDKVPSPHSFVFDKMQDALVTVFTKIELESEEEE
ncbi:MAG: hypothetical protein ACYTFW_16890 [Planctomycetota bacterium]|jgi:hypothetical protein